MKNTHNPRTPESMAFRLLTLMLGLTLTCGTARAVVRSWTGLGANNLWTNELNWSEADVPDTADEDAHVDGDSGTTSAPVFTMPAGASVTIGSLTVDAGDSTTINKVNLGSASSSASITLQGALENHGDLTTGGSTGSNGTHGNNFYVTVAGGAGGTFNHDGATLYAKSLSGYRRTNTEFNLPADNRNDGTVYIQNGTSQGGGVMRFRLTGEDHATFVNNGLFAVEGRGGSSGGDQPWCIFGPATANLVLTLGGTGTVVLASGLSSRTDSFAILTGHVSGCSLTNGPAHTIRGSGYISRGGSNGRTSVQPLAATVNAGLILAEPSTSVSNLFIAASGGSVENLAGARMVSASTDMRLKIGSDTAAGTFTNDGVLEACTGGTVQFATNLVATLGGTLRGGGTFVGSPTLTLAATTLQPGDSMNADGTGASTVGTLSVDGHLVLAETTTIAVQLGDAVEAGVDYDTVSVSGNLTLDGTLAVEALPGYGAGVYRLFTCAPGGLTDNGLTTVPGAVVVADVDAGTVDLVVANPATVLLLR